RLALWHGLPTVPLVRPQVSSCARGRPQRGDLRSGAWPGQETRPQRGSALWHGLPTVPLVRPQVSSSAGGGPEEEPFGRGRGRVRRPGHNGRRPNCPGSSPTAVRSPNGGREVAAGEF